MNRNAIVTNETPARTSLINTTHGLLDEAALTRTVGFEDRPSEFVVWVEWRLVAEIVRRDAHVILKTPSVVADAIVGAL